MNLSPTQLKKLFVVLLTTIVSSTTTLCPVWADGDPIVVMQTTKGRIVIRVFRNMVPNTANNFLDLVSRGYYNGKLFHRVEGWVVQGGCPFGNGTGDYTEPDTGQKRYIRLEINRNLNHNAPGVVAMARGQSRDSASCQFYILKKSMPQLNGQYAVFGGVVDGLANIYRIGPGDRIISAQIANMQRRQPAASSESDQSSSSSGSGSASGSSGSGTGASTGEPPSGASGF